MAPRRGSSSWGTEGAPARLPSIAGTSARRLGVVIGLFLAVTAFLVAYNARATLRERDQTLVVNVAARQPALAERYIKAVVLLHGGMVRAVQGAEAEIEIPPVSTDWRVLAKLTQEARLIREMVRTG